MFSAEQDEGVEHDPNDVTIGVDENVYSFFQFIVPSEKKKEGKGVTMDILAARFLVALCIGMQLLALFAVYQSVVLKDVKWSKKVMTVGGKSWGLFDTLEPGCNDGGSLCQLDAVTNEYTCAPPSVQLTGRWDDLDTDGDGVWTFEDAQRERETLQCKYSVDPVEVFNVFVNILMLREGLIWIHPDLRAGKKIFKPYFEYLKGDIIMCGYGVVDMCPNLLERGFFNAPLELNTSPRVGNTTESALKYCKRLLEEQGTCDQLLPSTYAVWKKEGIDQCGDPDYDRYVFKHPVDDKPKSLLKVDYNARQDYEMFQTPMYFIYKSVILFIWGLVILSELKTIINLYQWVFYFPPAGPCEYVDNKQIKGIDRPHRITNFLIAIERSFVLVMLCYIGTLFLLKSGDYVDLLFDAVALVFILEFGEILYTKAVRRQLQNQVGELQFMKFQGKSFSTYLALRPGLVDMIWIWVFMIAVVVIMHWYYTTIVYPVFDALQCTCLNIGDNCREAKTFNYDFWYDYWSNVVPRVLDQIDQMEAASASEAQPIKTLFHHRHHHHLALL